MKQFALLMALSLFATSAVMAAPVSTGEDDFAGDVPAVNEISVDSIQLGANDRLENLGAKAISKEPIFRYTISNNEPNGFKVALSSANAGRMIRKGGSNEVEGDFIDYTVTTLETDNSASNKFLGTSEPTQLNEDQLTETKVLDFVNGLKHATVDYTYELRLSSPEKPKLFRGTFEDTITVSIADNT